MTVTEGHGKYLVIFEPLQNVQTSRSTYKVTSFIDFTPYLEYFHQFEKYLEAFRMSIQEFKGDPILQEFREATIIATSDKRGKPAGTTLLVMPNLYCINYALNRLGNWPIKGKEKGV